MDEETKKMLDEITGNIEAKVKSLVDDNTKGLVDEKTLKERVDEINEMAKGLTTKDEVQTLQKNLEKVEGLIQEVKDSTIKQGETLAFLKNKGGEKPQTIKDMLREAVMEKADKCLQEVNDDYGKRLSFKDYFDNGARITPKFKIGNANAILNKSAVDMLQSNIVQSNVNTVRLTELDPQRVGIPTTIYPHAWDVFPKKNIKKANMSLLVVYSYEDNSGTKTEGSASGKSSFLLKTIEYKAFYLATHFLISDETLDDLDEVLDEIAVIGPDKIHDKIDSKIYADDGDNSTDIRGLFVNNQNCTDFSATGLGTEEDADIVSLISKAALQVKKAKYAPNAVFLNPTQINEIEGLRNAFEDSKQDRRVKFDGMGNLVAISGMRVIASEFVGEGTLCVGDVSKAMIGNRKDMTMEIGYIDDQLIEGEKTVALKIRLAFGVRDKAAFVYSSDISTDITSINAGT